MKKWLLAAILIFAIFFRFNNFNWDENFHLHPDERFLTMVAGDMTQPNFFVYGKLPLTLNKKLAVLLDKDNYNDFTILGRALSALADLLVVVLVYKTTELLAARYKLNNKLKYWAAFLYAIAVYPIQSAHFFTVDAFLNFFMFGCFYFALRQKTIASAIFFGLALASKVSAIFILPLIMILMLKPSLKQILLTLGLFFLVSYFTVHLASPNYFQNNNLFDGRINENFINNLKQLKSFDGNDAWYPPAVQWINKPATFVLTNLALVGVGLPYFIMIVLGIYYILRVKSRSSRRSSNHILLIVLFWVVGYFTYLSFQFVKSIRYTIFLYPFFAIFAALGVSVILNLFTLQGVQDLGKRFRNKFGMTVAYVSLAALILLWPLLFSTIYFHRNTRVEASAWIYKNLPQGSIILGEYWDDGLPLAIPETLGKSFVTEQLPVFDPDTPEKWSKMNEILARADYYVLSSNRGWGSIISAPGKYPQMSKFYKDLLAGRNRQYKKINEFKPYYFRFFELPNSWVEETFTVYDHPTVLIFAREK